MRYVGKIQWKTKMERIRYYTMRIELGIIPLEEKIISRFERFC
jgi:hypothetical protein